MTYKINSKVATERYSKSRCSRNSKTSNLKFEQRWFRTLSAALESHTSFSNADVDAKAIFWQPQHFGNVMTFVDTLVLVSTCFFGSHEYADSEKVLFRMKCFTKTIAFYLDPFHFCWLILHKNVLLLINLFCQRVFHLFACVVRVKRANLEDVVFIWIVSLNRMFLLHTALNRKSQ